MKREVDHDLHPLSCRVGELCLVWLARGQQALIDLTEVPRFAEKGSHSIKVFARASELLAMSSKEYRRNPDHRDGHRSEASTEDRNVDGECERVIHSELSRRLPLISGWLQPISTACPHPKNV